MFSVALKTIILYDIKNAKKGYKMKKLLILSLSVLCSCSIIYANSSFKYKTSEDWEEMTGEEVLHIIQNGGSVNEINEKNRYPLVEACLSSPNPEVILALLDANPTSKECALVMFIKNYYKFHHSEARNYDTKKLLDIMNCSYI